MLLDGLCAGPHIRFVKLWKCAVPRDVSTPGSYPNVGVCHPGILYSLTLGMAALSACSGASVAPQPPSSSPVGQFNLVEYDGGPLPVTLRVIVSVSAVPGDPRTSTCPEMLRSSSIQIASDGSVRRTSRLSYPCTGSLPRPADLPDSTTQTEVGRESVTGDSLTFSYAGAVGVVPRTEYSRVTGNDLVFYLSTQGAEVQRSVTSMHRVYRRQ